MNNLFLNKEQCGIITGKGNALSVPYIEIAHSGDFDPSALKFGDRLGDGEGIATVVGRFEASDKTYVYAVLDAKYMNITTWGGNEIDTGLPNYTDSTVVLSASESATYNTDLIINNYTPTDYAAFNHCDTCASIELGGTTYKPKLPNAYELQQIYNNRSALYALDPTTSSYTDYNLANWNFSIYSIAWSSNEYNSSNAWFLNSFGECINDSKHSAYYSCGVLPIFEIEIPKKYFTLTISPTPTDATVTLTAEGYTQSGNSITVDSGTTVSYKVEKSGYKTTEGSKVIEANESIEVTLTADFDPSALKFGDRLGDIATVVGRFEASDKTYVYAVLDAKYRIGAQNWGVEGTDTELPNYADSVSVLNTKESATYNTDYILNNYDTTYYFAFTASRNAISIKLGGKTYLSQLPNVYELQQIYNNRSALDNLDPTVNDYYSNSLLIWNMGGNSGYCVWSSNEYDSDFAWEMKSDGNLEGYAAKSYSNGVIPILEIPLE